MKKQDYDQKSQRLSQIRKELESKGYSLECDETDGARLYKNNEFIHVPELQPLVDEYFNLWLLVNEHTNDFDGTFKE